MDYKEFFTTNNLSGWKTREVILQKNEPEIYGKVKSFISENKLDGLSFKEEIWHFINDVKEKPKCLTCGKLVCFRDTLTKGYRSFCSLKCTNENPITQIRATNKIKEKYGVNSFPEHHSFSEKVKKTKLKHYGDEKYNNLDKARSTKQEKYGDLNYNNKDKIGITVRNKFIELLSTKTKDRLIKYELSDDNLTMKCSVCNKEYEIGHNLINSRINVNVNPCTICNPIKNTKSIQEKELFEWVRDLLPNETVISKDKSLISNLKPLEIDVYIPSRNLGVEFDGIYWHSEKFSDRFGDSKNLLYKTNKCGEKDTQLIHIFEDEWIYKRDIVKSIIKSRLSLFDKKIFARKCEVRQVGIEESRNFLIENHIQGGVNAKIRLGLIYNGELVSLMTFGGLRLSLGLKKEDGHYEMYRFCNKLNTSVTGGFSKLLKHFINTYQPKSILTFSDNRYFDGGIYAKNKFEYICDTKPNYFYIVKHKRENRFKYRKDVLIKEGFDPSKTEREIMEERKINRIYDCGSKKWLLRG